MGILDVLHFPDPRLRRPSEPIEKITDELHQLAADNVLRGVPRSGAHLNAEDAQLASAVHDIVGDDGAAEVRPRPAPRPP